MDHDASSFTRSGGGTDTVLADQRDLQPDDDLEECHVCKYFWNPRGTARCGWPDCAKNHPGTS